MKKSDAEKLLKGYNTIDDDIKMCRNLIKDYEQTYYNTIGAMNYDGMPKATGKSDKTAKTAIRNAHHDTSIQLAAWESRIRELNKIRTEILKEITSMKMIHKVVLTGFYIKGDRWEQIAEQIGYSVRQAQNHRAEALEIIAKKLTRNRYIIRSKIVKEMLS